MADSSEQNERVPLVGSNARASYTTAKSQTSPAGTSSRISYAATKSQSDLRGFDRNDSGHQSATLGAASSCREAKRALTAKEMVSKSRGFVDTYNVAAMSTPRVLVTYAGTVFENQILRMSEGLVIVVYILTAVLVTCCHGAGWALHDVQTWVKSMEDRSQHFVFSFQFLVAFLLSFYVSLSITRWWSLRVEGIGKIERASHDLLLFLSRFVTPNFEILETVSRYSQASLVLLFADRANQWENSLVLDLKLVDEEDWEDILPMKNMPRAMWEFITDIVAALHKNGQITSDSQLTFYLQMCSMGCEGVDHVQRQLSTMIPLPYVHIICLLVKIHNLLLAVLYGAFTACYGIMGQYAMCVQILVQVLVTTTAYNACLAIAEVLSDPFAGEANDFNLPRILKGIQEACADAGARTGHYEKWSVSPRLQFAGVKYSEVDLQEDP